MFWEVVTLPMTAGVMPGGRRALGKFRTDSGLWEGQVEAHRAGSGRGSE